MTYIIILIVLFLLEFVYFKLADQFNIIDKPNERSSHKQITLLGGGIIFYLAVVIYFLMNGFQYMWFFTGLTLISAISFIDDLKPQSSRLRLAIHLMSMLFLFFQLGVFEMHWTLILLSLIIAIGILNAYNFMDGINGMIGVYTTVVLGSLWYINNFILTFVDERIIYYLLLALVVFNFFNFRKKARCFAGDVGAVSLAFIVIFLLGMLILKSGNIAWIGLLAVFGVDTILTIIHRLILKENILIAHRKHLFQLLANELKFSHLVVSSVYALVQVLVSVGLIFFENHAYWFLAISILLLSIVYYAVKKKYFYLHLQLKTN
ncbi:putative undecaprenyl-phosphate N-acetylglucosaminyl 1-phosphate transferase [bioreactor metagenome]|uniref:Putative undecaprenyl-phosphate N-acetylglucosaminyl 1-phosphate transferase n=1 Tax=bioreactor metagenome TaxID=1076179 RepID=A0A644US20_9ZZZZ|nr:glycosyltransferase family 4 protein [Paludibacter sp.]